MTGSPGYAPATASEKSSATASGGPESNSRQAARVVWSIKSIVFLGNGSTLWLVFGVSASLFRDQIIVYLGNGSTLARFRCQCEPFSRNNRLRNREIDHTKRRNHLAARRIGSVTTKLVDFPSISE